MEPKELRRERKVRTTAVNASEAGVTIKKPVESRVQNGRGEDSWSAKKRNMAGKVGEGVRDKE
jgi:hypothetical protein